MLISPVHLKNRLFFDVELIITHHIFLQEGDSESRQPPNSGFVNNHLIVARNITDVDVDIEYQFLRVASNESVERENRDVLLARVHGK